MGHRTTKILEITQYTSWNHVPGVDNPADDISRGLSATTLTSQQRWWNGPPWLALSEDNWPIQPLLSDQQPSPMLTDQLRPTACLASVRCTDSEFASTLFQRYSSLTTLKRIMAYIMRYVGILRESAARNYPNGACALAGMQPMEYTKYLSVLYTHRPKTSFLHQSALAIKTLRMVRHNRIITE